MKRREKSRKEKKNGKRRGHRRKKRKRKMAREKKIRREYDLIFHFSIKYSYGSWSKIISEKDHNSYCLCKIEMIVFMA